MGYRQAYEKGSACSRASFRGNGPLVAFDNLFTDRQTHAGSFIVTAAMQPLKQLKDAISILIIKPDAVIGKDQLTVCRFIEDADRRATPFDLQMRCYPGSMKLQSVSQQILKELPHLEFIRVDGGQ